jgi:hypothetical protein
MTHGGIDGWIILVTWGAVLAAGIVSLGYGAWRMPRALINVPGRGHALGNAMVTQTQTPAGDDGGAS